MPLSYGRPSQKGFAHLLVLVIILGLIVVVGFFVLKGSGLQDKLKKAVTGRKSLPLVSFSKPFEDGYFTALDNAKVVSTIGDIEITTDPAPYTFYDPLDGHVARTVLVKNIGTSEVQVRFRPEISIANFDDSMFINHPQPGALFLDPGEIQPIRLIYSPRTDSIGKPGTKISAPMTLTLSQSKKGGQGTIAGEDYKLTFNNTVEVVADLPGNATIKGVVKESSGKVIKNTSVNILSSFGKRNVVTDANGNFTAKVNAYKYTGTSHWSEFILSVKNKSLVVTLQEGETKEVEIVYSESDRKADYEVKSKLDIGLQAYAWDVSSDGSVFATVPFHSALPAEEIEKLAYLNVFDANGKLLFKHHLKAETPTVDVSEDGTLIATAARRSKVGRPEEFGGDAIVLDKSGKVVLTFSPPETKFWWGNLSEPIVEVRLSGDNKYLAAGDTFGRLYLVEVSTGKIVWEKFVEGQVRRLWFDEGNVDRLFASSGDGYLRAFNREGELIWKTFIDAWATDLDVSKNYILTTSKSMRALIHLIDKSTGKTVWSYPVEQRGADVFIAPDESYIFYGTQIGGIGTVLKSSIHDINGNPLFNMIPSSGAAKATSDSNYIAVKNDQEILIYDRDGYLLGRETLLPGDNFSGGGNNFLYISPDGKRIITAMPKKDNNRMGEVYFLEGGIVKGKPETTEQVGPAGGDGAPLPPKDGEEMQPGTQGEGQIKPPSGSDLCGDGVCDEAETANPQLCPADCN